MAAEIFETQSSRAQTVSVDAPKADTDWTVQGTDDDNEVKALVLLTIPAFYQGLIFLSFEMKPRFTGVWDITVHYGRQQPGTPGTMTIEGDTGNEQVKMTHSLASQYFPASVEEEDEPWGGGEDDESDGDDGDEDGGEDDPGGEKQPVINFRGAILVRERGGNLEPEGIEETFPSQSLVINRFFGTDTAGNNFPLTVGYVQLMLDKAHHVNTDTIDIVIQGLAFHFNPGEFWYKGSTFKVGSDGHSEVNMKVGFSPNLVNEKMGGVTYSKKGWHFVWPFSEQFEDTIDDDNPNATNLMIPRVRQVCVEQTKRETTLAEIFT